MTMLWTDRRVAMLGLVVAVATIPLLAVATFAAPRGEAFAAFILEYGWAVTAFGAVSAVFVSLTVVWLVGLRAVLVERSRRWLVLDGALIVGVFGFVTTLVAYPMLAALAFSGGTGEEVGVLSDVAFAVLNVGTGPPTAISIAAFGLVLAQSELRSGLIIGITPFVVAAHLALAVAFLPGDLLSPSGAITWLAPLLYYVWVAVVSLRILRAVRGRLPLGHDEDAARRT